ncbi:MAG: helix-turn-helix domain-containing protein, partial [Comamonas sp.]
EHFALQAAARHQRPVPELTAERLNTLMAHDWPGNVRELRNVAERMTLGIETGSAPFGSPVAGNPQSLAATVESIERALIAEALRANEGSLTRTAQVLNTPKTTLHDKIRKYGL